MIAKELVEIIPGARRSDSPQLTGGEPWLTYVTSATTKGGRNGRAMLDNGALARNGRAQGSWRRRRRT
jgi:hypothetical protein